MKKTSAAAQQNLYKMNNNVDPPLESLFSYSKLQWSDGTWIQFLWLAVYSPVGIVLLVVRLVLLAPLIVAVAVRGGQGFPCAVSRLLLPIYGFWITAPAGVPRFCSDSNSACPPVICCNHRSGIMDVFPFLALTKVRVVLDAGYFTQFWLARRFLHFLGAIGIRRMSNSTNAAPASDRDLVRSAVHAASNRPLLVFSEGWDTNGRALLLYQKFLFGLTDVKIQVCAMRVYAGMRLPVNVGQLGTTITWDLVWLFFLPYTVFELFFLQQPVQRRDTETDIMFARRVQQATASVLGIRATSHSFKDALSLRKRLLSPLTSD